jgi:2-methylisocitrate lyase-like PEP mutase family enzyme
MIEDQVAPKRCGHTAGKDVVDHAAAVARLRAAIDPRDEGADICILARTDARAVIGLPEAIRRARAFAELGADILFVEAPESEAEMRQICNAVPGCHLANMLEGGRTPVLPPARLGELGYALAAYPLTLLAAAIRAMQEALADLAGGRDPRQRLIDFASLRRLVGFDAYEAEARRYTPPE